MIIGTILFESCTDCKQKPETQPVVHANLVWLQHLSHAYTGRRDATGRRDEATEWEARDTGRWSCDGARSDTTGRNSQTGWGVDVTGPGLYRVASHPVTSWEGTRQDGSRFRPILQEHTGTGASGL